MTFSKVVSLIEQLLASGVAKVTLPLSNDKLWLGGVDGIAHEQSMSGAGTITNAGVLAITGQILPSSILMGDGTTKIAFDSVGADFAHLSSGVAVTETGTNDNDIKNIRCQLTSMEALTGKHLKSIYSRVDVDHACTDAYCFQGSMRLTGVVSTTGYGISQTVVIKTGTQPEVYGSYITFAGHTSDHTQHTGTVSGVSAVYNGGNSHAGFKATSIFRGGGAAYCSVGAVLHAAGEAAIDNIIQVSNGEGTPKFVKFDVATAVNCITSSGAGTATNPGAVGFYNIVIDIAGTPCYILATKSPWTNT
jgi:hypothetical protein